VKLVQDADVRAALRRVWPDAATVEQTQIRALGGGLIARSFLAIGGGRRHVLRLPVASSMAWLDLATEARALRAAAAADLAPPVIAVDLEAGLLLTEYQPTLWTPELLQQPTAVTMIVRTLRALHGLPIDLPAYSLERFASNYLTALATSTKRALSSEEGKWAAELTRLGREFDARYAPTAFCHNDLGAANILIDGAAARLIDFEYAGLGAPLLDLASLAGMNDFPEPRRRQLLDEYFGAAAAPPPRDLDNAIRMVRLLAYFWSSVAEQRLAEANAHADLGASIGATLRRG
jgi:thiamine kinase